MTNNLITLDQSATNTDLTITQTMISADENDAFCRAFNMIARAALPFMAPDCPFFSDLLYDAARAAKLPVNEHVYFLVRDYGTNHFSDPVDAMRHCHDRSDGVAVLRVDRLPFDNFKAEIIYTRADGYVGII